MLYNLRKSLHMPYNPDSKGLQSGPWFCILTVSFHLFLCLVWHMGVTLWPFWEAVIKIRLYQKVFLWLPVPTYLSYFTSDFSPSFYPSLAFSGLVITEYIYTTILWPPCFPSGIIISLHNLENYYPFISADSKI